jgi:hypothetical protein
MTWLPRPGPICTGVSYTAGTLSRPSYSKASRSEAAPASEAELAPAGGPSFSQAALWYSWAACCSACALTQPYLLAYVSMPTQTAAKVFMMVAPVSSHSMAVLRHLSLSSRRASGGLMLTSTIAFRWQHQPRKPCFACNLAAPAATHPILTQARSPQPSTTDPLTTHKLGHWEC